MIKRHNYVILLSATPYILKKLLCLSGYLIQTGKETLQNTIMGRGRLVVTLFTSLNISQGRVILTAHTQKNCSLNSFFPFVATCLNRGPYWHTIWANCKIFLNNLSYTSEKGSIYIWATSKYVCDNLPQPCIYENKPLL